MPAAPHPRPFTALEDAILHAERADAPMVMGFTLPLDGHLDISTLSSALRLVRDQCPMMAARRQPLRRWQRWPQWRFDAAAPVISLVDSSQPLAAETFWTECLADPFDLDHGPLVRVSVVRRTDADTLVVAFHHSAVDGMGALGAMQLLASAYTTLASRPSGSRLADSEPPVSGDTHSDGIRSGGSVGHARSRRTDSERRGAGSGRSVLAIVRAPRSARIRTSSPPGSTVGRELTGHGVTHRWLDANLTDALVSRARVHGVTVTDLLVSALHLTIAKWNGHGEDLMTVTVPVRPSSTTTARDHGQLNARIVGGTDSPTSVLDSCMNRTLQVTTTTTARQRLEPARCMVVVSEQIGVARIDEDAGAEPAVAGVFRFLPEKWRRQIPLIGSRVTGDRFLASSRLSNLGVVRADSLTFGPLATQHVGFSTPVRMPQGITLGVVGYDGRLDLAFRWCRPSFDESDVHVFADTFECMLHDTRL